MAVPKVRVWPTKNLEEIIIDFDQAAVQAAFADDNRGRLTFSRIGASVLLADLMHALNSSVGGIDYPQYPHHEACKDP